MTKIEPVAEADPVAEIAALTADVSLSRDEKQSAICAVKSAVWEKIDPASIKVEGVTLSRVVNAGEMVVIEGEGGGIDWPLQVVNGPFLVQDDAGDVVRVEQDEKGVEVEVRYRVDPATVLTRLLASLAGVK